MMNNNHPNAVDTTSNRSTRKYTNIEILRRVAWGLFYPFFRFSPRIAFGWRNLVLRSFGARIGSGVHIYNSAIIYMPWNLEIGEWSSIGEGAYLYNLGPVTIGNHVTISQRAHLCGGTHDYEDPKMPLIKEKIKIEDFAWICADAFIGPGVIVGRGSVVGARAVLMKSIGTWLVFGGNPARKLGTRKMADSGA